MDVVMLLEIVTGLLTLIRRYGKDIQRLNIMGTCSFCVYKAYRVKR